MSYDYSQGRTNTMGDTEQSLLKQNRQAALSLPEPGDDWACAETDLERQDIQTLKQAGAIRHHSWEYVEPEREYSGGNYQRQRWVTVGEVYRWIKQHLPTPNECPAPDCHATGMHNPKGVDGYRCSNDECDRELTREEAKRLIR